MTIQSGFFNSINGDRKYSATNFAQYFASFIGNGVFPAPSTGLQVMESENMDIVIKAGKGWINGYFVVNDGDYTLTLDNADGVLKRIDRVVMRLNYLTRQIEIDVKKGTFASNPVAPTLQRDTEFYELGLADVLIGAGTTQITPSNITDLRLSNELCGIVHGVVDQVSTETLYQQYLDFWNDWRAQQVNEFEQFQTDAQTEFDAQMQTNQATFDNQTVMNQQEFDDWFITIQDILDGNVAGNLLTMINDLTNEFEVHEVQKASKSIFGHVKVGDGLNVENGVISVVSKITTIEGTYNGDGTHPRTITIGVTPKFLFLSNLDGANAQIAITGYNSSANSLGDFATGQDNVQSQRPVNATHLKIVDNGFEVTQAGAGTGFNVNGETYGWVAIL